nr:MAG TPA: hypothetical protein [Caudoviricetes sp.]
MACHKTPLLRSLRGSVPASWRCVKKSKKVVDLFC